MQKTAYEIMPSLVGSEMCIRDRKERVRSKATPRKRVVEEKRRRVPERESEGCRRACLGSIENKVQEHLLMFSGIDHSVDHSAMMFSAACTTEVATPTELDEDQTARSSAKREKRREGI